MRSTRFIVCLLSILLACGACSRKAPETAGAPADAASKPDSPAATPQAYAPAAAPAPKPAPTPMPVVIPAGTVITVRLGEALSSKTSKTGDSFTATVADAVLVDGKTAIPAASTARGTVVEAKAKGKLKGEARLKLALNKITIKDKTYLIETTMSALTMKGKGKRTAATTGGGAGLGAIVGGIAGGGKGAGIGALVGGGAGFVGGAFTGNKQIELPAETAVSFKLMEPITLK